MSIYPDVAVYFNGERVPDVASVEYAAEPRVAPSPSKYFSMVVSCISTSCDALAGLLSRPAAGVPIGLTVPLAALTSVLARRRVTRSGRLIYGAHPKHGSRYWTDRSGDKLERRKVRSRLAALCRGANENLGMWWVRGQRTKLDAGKYSMELDLVKAEERV